MESNEQELNNLTIKELKDQLLRLNLVRTGNKEQLIQRLLNNTNVEPNENEERNVDEEIPANNETEREENIVEVDTTPVIRRRERLNENKINFTPSDLMNILPNYDPDDVCGITADEWIKRVQKLKNYYKWNDDLILISIGPKLKNSARTWYDKTDDFYVIWEDFVSQFKKKFTPIYNEADVHISMMNRKRQNSESLLQYLEEMTKLGMKGNLKENVLVKYFIMGMRDGDLFSVFQGQIIETLDELRGRITWCESLRKRNYKDDRNKPSFSKNNLHYQNKDNNSFGNKYDYNKFASNKYEYNKYENKKKPLVELSRKCFNCDRPGHFAKDCLVPSRRHRCTKCNRVHKKGEPAECLESLKVGYIECTTLPSSCHKLIKIKDIEILALIDTGSAGTLIKKEFADEILHEKKYVHTNVTGFFGGTCIANNKMILNLKIDDIEVEAHVIIVENSFMPEPMVIGRDVTDLPGIVMIKENGMLTLKQYKNNLIEDIENENDTFEFDENNEHEYFDREINTNDLKIARTNMKSINCENIKENINENEIKTNNHMVMIRELQKLYADERHLKENLEMQLNDLKTEITSSSILGNKIKELTVELKEVKEKVKQNEIDSIKESDTSGIIVQDIQLILQQLQSEMKQLKQQHSIAICAEQKRVYVAEERRIKLAALHEDRVVNLEARLAELSSTVGTYERLHQQDQKNLQKLKEEISRLVSTSKEREMPEEQQENIKINCKQEQDEQSLYDDIDQLKKSLKIENSRSQNSMDNTNKKEYCIENGRLFKKINDDKRWVVPKMVRWRIVIFDFKLRDILKNKIILDLHDELNTDSENILIIRENVAKRIDSQRQEWKERFDHKHRKPKRYLVEDIPGAARNNRSYTEIFSSDNMKIWCCPHDEETDNEEIESTAEIEDDLMSGQPNCNST